jgi:hypothetical protein
MSDPKHWRARALHCADLAQSTGSPRLRELLLGLTKTWLNLASDLERTRGGDQSNGAPGDNAPTPAPVNTAPVHNASACEALVHDMPLHNASVHDAPTAYGLHPRKQDAA